MMEITIDGLTAKQKVLADIIWQFDDFVDVKRFMDTLPVIERRECEAIVELMKMATLEQLYDGIKDNHEANMVIDKISKR
jgi:hypothetical protein